MTAHPSLTLSFSWFGVGLSFAQKVDEGWTTRTKPLARQTLRVSVGRGFLFDRLLSRCGRSNILSDAPAMECSQ
jgi:hypothetical protein